MGCIRAGPEADRRWCQHSELLLFAFEQAENAGPTGVPREILTFVTVCGVTQVSSLREPSPIVVLEWFWAYLTYHPSTRLITGDVAIVSRSTVARSTVGFQREE